MARTTPVSAIPWPFVLLLDLWHWQQRRIDLSILWPACKKQAGGDLDDARAAFAVHAFRDPAWTCLGHDEVVARIDALR